MSVHSAKSEGAAIIDNEMAPGPVRQDLIAPLVALEPRFPLDLQATRIVLYEAAQGDVHAHWQLASDDRMRASADFSPAEGVPAAYLRVLRLDNGHDPQVYASAPLSTRGLGGRGLMSFAIEPVSRRYRAELGLVSASGGWLLLARSNILDSAASIPLRAVLARARAARDAAAGLPSDAPRPPLSTPSGAQQVTPRRSGTDESSGAEVFSHLPVLEYGRALERNAGVRVEARLCIQGSAPPNSDIDLFGHPYRVGPGGRFQLELVVDDRDLLRAALAKHPPPQLGLQREE